MQTLGELRYAFILTPLLFVFTMYFVSGNLIFLGANFLLALMAGAIVSILTSYIPLTGNSEATFLSFTVGFALAFWGISIAGFSGQLDGLVRWADSIASFLEGRPAPLATNNTSLNVNMLNSFNSAFPTVGGWSGTSLWMTMMIVLSFIYCLGIYFMVVSRGH